MSFCITTEYFYDLVRLQGFIYDLLYFCCNFYITLYNYSCDIFYFYQDFYMILLDYSHSYMTFYIITKTFTLPC